MAQEEQEPQQSGQQQDEEFVKANPALNPRNQVMAEIAKGVFKQHAVDAGETAPTVDDEHNVEGAVPAEQPAAAEEPPAEEAPAEEPAAAAETPAAEDGVDVIEPDAEYEVKVDGQPLRVPGHKLIEAGIRTFQKETAADYRLKQATEILQEAERRAQTMQQRPVEQPQAPAPREPTEADLAAAIQFGTPEQAAQAIALLKSRPTVTEEQVTRLVDSRSRAAARDELQFNEALNFVKAEYGDLLSNDYLKRLFFVEESRYRTPKERGGLGDQRSYKEVYQEIGDSLRKAFNMPKQSTTAQPSHQPSTPGTAAVRVARKAAAPSVPRTAASRLEQAEVASKAKTPTEIIAGIAAARGKNRLSTPTRKEA